MKEKVQWKKVRRGSTLLFALAFALWLLVEGLASVSSAATAAKVTTRAANIRAEASASSTAVGSVKENDTIEILGQTVGGDGKVWYQIYVNATTTGYIRSDLVQITDGSTPPSIEAGNTATATPDPSEGSAGENTEAEQVTPVGGKVSGSNTVRVRTSPSTANANNVLTSVANGTEVTVVARTTGADNMVWYQIKFTVNNQEAIGYIRSDYVTLSGELTPLSEVQVTPPEEPEVQPSAPPQEEEQEQTKRYETKKMKDKWYILDYEAGQQYEIEALFSAADQYKALYEDEQKKAGTQKVWIVVLAVCTFFFLGCAAYLLYRVKDYKESAFIASIEKNTVSGRARTAERSRNDASRSSGDRPVIRDGMGSQKVEGQHIQGQRPSGGQGAQRSSGVQGQKPAGSQGTQRPAGASQGSQRPSGTQAAQKSASPQGQKPAAPQGGQRPVGSQRPGSAQGGQRPANPQVQRSAGTPGNQKPASASGQRAVSPSEQKTARPQNPEPSGNRGRSVNFMKEADDVDFEVLNWDSDEE